MSLPVTGYSFRYCIVFEVCRYLPYWVVSFGCYWFLVWYLGEIRHTTIRIPLFGRYEGVPAEAHALRPYGDFGAGADKCVFPNRKYQSARCCGVRKLYHRSLLFAKLVTCLAVGKIDHRIPTGNWRCEFSIFVKSAFLGLLLPLGEVFATLYYWVV